MDLFVKYLKEKNCKESFIESALSCGDTPLVIASAQGWIELVELLLKNGQDINETCGSDKTFALNVAVTENRPEVVKFLIENGADVNLETGLGDNPLMSAICMEKKEIAKILVSSGAKVNKKFMNRFEYIMMNCICADKELAQIALETVEDPEIIKKWNFVYDDF